LPHVGAAATTKQTGGNTMNSMNTVNTLGKKFSHWRVLVADRNHVTCICRCGTVRIFNINELNEMPPSCGCTRRE
jgi:hypothetical protein